MKTAMCCCVALLLLANIGLAQQYDTRGMVPVQPIHTPIVGSPAPAPSPPPYEWFRDGYRESWTHEFRPLNRVTDQPQWTYQQPATYQREIPVTPWIPAVPSTYYHANPTYCPPATYYQAQPTYYQRPVCPIWPW